MTSLNQTFSLRPDVVAALETFFRVQRQVFGYLKEGHWHFLSAVAMKGWQVAHMYSRPQGF